MKYERVVKGVFKNRPNRFIANVEIDGVVEVVHVKNTGRCRELLTENAIVFCEESSNPNRKTRYDLIAVYKGDILINMDSQAPNKVFMEYLKSGNCIGKLDYIKREYTYSNSRIDFYCEKGEDKYLIEVKGVTLENNGIVAFPDAPTLRGVKHIEELIKATQEGYNTAVAFVVQMEEVKYFVPNDETHIEFGNALRKAEKAGVKILCLNCSVEYNALNILGKIDYRL